MNFTEAICVAHRQIMRNNPKSLILGMGANYMPNGIDGTTKGLCQEFPGRVWDVPASEVAVTGAAVGMASRGFRPIVHHGRVEFAMLAFDQIFTHASRWDFMFGGNYPCPLTLRICIGRQWGSGPQHTANYHSIFLQTPGLDVYIPATPQDAYRSLITSSKSEHPSVILEHRWLYKTKEDFITDCDNDSFPCASVYGNGNDFVILTYAEGLIDALKALEFCSAKGISGRVVCFKFFSGKDRFPETIKDVLSGTKNIIIYDSAPFEFGILSGIFSYLVSVDSWEAKKVKIIAPEFRPCPASPKLAGIYYPNAKEISEAIKQLGYNLSEFPAYSFDELHFPPNFDFSSFEPKNIFI
jgi:pyruvate dehydrogenase E1 component beta subunit